MRAPGHLIALGGSAYATHPGGANTINSGDIIDGQVQNADLGSNAVSGSKGWAASETDRVRACAHVYELERPIHVESHERPDP